MHTTKPLTPPATGGVFRSPPLARARVDCTDVQSVVRRDYLHNLLSLDHARARTPAKRGAAIQKPDAYYRKLRLAKFGGDFNPIEAAVDEAVAAFAGAHPDQDRRVWLKIANRVGADAFMDAVWQKAAEIREDEARGRRLRNKAAAFQQLLNRRFPREGGAK